MSVKNSDIMDALRLRSLLQPGSTNPDTVFTRLEFDLSRTMALEIIRRSSNGAAEVDVMVRKHLGTKFAEAVIAKLPITSTRSTDDSVKYQVGAIVLSKQEFMDIIKFCLDHFCPIKIEPDANNDTD